MGVSQTLTVTESSVNKSDNTSKVRILWKSTQTGESWNGYERTGYYYVSINGGAETKYSVEYSLPPESTVTIVDTTIIVPHKDNGTGTVKVRTWMNTDISAGVVENSKTLTLTTIARASTIDSLTCATKYFTGKLTYKYTPKASSYYNRCNISLNLDGEYIAVKSVLLGQKSASQKTATVTFSEDELSIIYNELPKTTKGTLRFTFRTYSDGDYSTQIGDAVYREITLSIPNTTATQPTATMTLSPVSSLDSPIDTLYIKGRSKVDANFTNGAGKYGASIVSYKMRVGGKDYGSPYTSGYLSTTGDITVTGIITDSRGFTKEYEQTITVISYSEPKILPASDENAIICARCDVDGNLTESGTYLKIKARRSYYKVTADGVQNNFCAIRYRYRNEGTNTFSSWKTILAKDDTSTNTIDSDPISGVVSSAETSYIVQVGVIDDLGESAAVQVIIPSDFVTIDCPEEFKGRRMAFFRYVGEATEDGLYMGLPLFGGSIDSLKLGTRITATSTAPISLNDYKTPGCFYSPSAENSQYITETPYTDGGFGLIVREMQSTKYIRQEIYYGRTNWQRHWDGTEWSEWLRYLMTSQETSTAADFVTEIDLYETDTGSWRYKKWKSGTYDLSGVFDVTPISAGTTGGVYYSEQIQIKLPFSVETIQYTGSPVEQYCLFVNAALVSKGDADNNGIIGFRLMRFIDFSTEAVSVRIIARGRWK